MLLILLGPPGSGKGTISDRLEKEFGFFHISPGALLREETKKGTPIGNEIAKYIDKGHIVPTNIVVEMMKLEARGKKQVIFDGFPRSLEQVQAWPDLKSDLVLYLDVSEEVLVKRLSGRRVCTKNQHGFHLQNFPPKKKSFCDYDGSRLIRRKDDQPAIVQERFREYYRLTHPLVGHYRKKKLLQTIDGDQEPEQVYAEVKKALRKWVGKKTH